MTSAKLARFHEYDQAEGLRRLVTVPTVSSVRTVAITSGKGGVGKTNISINLAIALASMQHRVMLMDADLGLSNVDVLLGLYPKKDLSHVIRGLCSLDDIIMPGPGGIEVVPAASGTYAMSSLTPEEYIGLLQAFSQYKKQIDFLLIDTAAGITSSVVWFSRAVQEVLVVVCDEPTSLTDAYALMKVLSREHDITRFNILANKMPNIKSGQRLYEKLAKVVNKFLDIQLSFMGVLPYDESMLKAVRRQQPVMTAFPHSKSAIAFKALAKCVDNLPRPTQSMGHLELFVERLIRASRNEAEVSL